MELLVGFGLPNSPPPTPSTGNILIVINVPPNAPASWLSRTGLIFFVVSDQLEISTFQSQHQPTPVEEEAEKLYFL